MKLGLAVGADTIVGNDLVWGSIGHELLVNMSLLFLDPMSGLNSTAAARLVATLSALARKGLLGVEHALNV
jgi:ABC-type branched-subunit amino acid transport system ATPase component